MKTEIKTLEKNATFEEMFEKIIEVCVANGVPRSFLFGACEKEIKNGN